MGGMSLSGGGEADTPSHGDDGDGGGADDGAIRDGDDTMWSGCSGIVEGVKTVVVVGFVIGRAVGGSGGAGADRGERRSLPSTSRSRSSSTLLRCRLVGFTGGD
jgi:hypothetical protein